MTQNSDSAQQHRVPLVMLLIFGTIGLGVASWRLWVWRYGADEQLLMSRQARGAVVQPPPPSLDRYKQMVKSGASADDRKEELDRYHGAADRLFNEREVEFHKRAALMRKWDLIAGCMLMLLAGGILLQAHRMAQASR